MGGAPSPGLRSAASMFDDLIDTPCGTTGGHSGLPVSLLHSRHSGNSSDSFVHAGEALELGVARGPARGVPPHVTAGHLNPASSRSYQKTLRIREPQSVPYNRAGAILALRRLVLYSVSLTSSGPSSRGVRCR